MTTSCSSCCVTSEEWAASKLVRVRAGASSCVERANNTWHPACRSHLKPGSEPGDSEQWHRLKMIVGISRGRGSLSTCPDLAKQTRFRRKLRLRPRAEDGRSESHTNVVFHPRCVEKEWEAPICFEPCFVPGRLGQEHLFRGYRFYEWPRDKQHLSPVNGRKYFLLQPHCFWGVTDKCTVSSFRRWVQCLCLLHSFGERQLVMPSQIMILKYS